LLISLFARCKPELINAQIPDVLDNVEPQDAIASSHLADSPKRDREGMIVIVGQGCLQARVIKFWEEAL
jgi:hypothetical protein